jgi:hypothetical protein
MTMSRFKGFDAGPKRGNAYGRLYTVAGGAPNHPLVAFAASAGWLRVGSASFLTPQALIFERGFSKVGDALRLKEWIDDDLKAWRAEPNRANKPILIAVETSQAPNLCMALSEMFRADESEAARDVLAVGYRLRTGDQNVIERLGDMQSGAYDVGGNWLASWFDGTVPAEPPDDILHGRPFAPGRVAITFDRFQSEEAPGLRREAVRSSLSAAESLRAKSMKNADLSMALTADESKAAAIMIAVLAADRHPPPASPPKEGQNAWGWEPWNRTRWGDGPIRSRYVGIA